MRWSLPQTLLLAALVAVPAVASAGPFDDAMAILKDPGKLSKKLDTAKTKLEAALKADPKNAHAAYNLGLVHQRKGNTGAASKAWERALQISPDYTRPRRGWPSSTCGRGGRRRPRPS